MSHTPRSRSQGLKKWYPRKGLLTGKIHVKYQSSSTHCTKVINTVKVSQRMTEWQTGQKQYAPDLRSRKHKYMSETWVLSHVICYLCDHIKRVDKHLKKRKLNRILNWYAYEIPWNYNYSWVPMFADCQNFAGSWERYVMGTWFVASQCKAVHYFV